MNLAVPSTETKIEISASALLAKQVIEQAVSKGIVEFCLCPGGRNSVFYPYLMANKNLTVYFWSEERSAAFFALGRTRATQRPVAVITTSGTAVAELLPATMEAFYTGDPLLLITADRPRRFRGSGAPQACEQVGIFGVYAPLALDIAEGERVSLKEWNLQKPAHLNLCFEDPFAKLENALERLMEEQKPEKTKNEDLSHFFETVSRPLVVVSSLPEGSHQVVIKFLRELNAPIYLEGVSGIRERTELADLRIVRAEQLWTHATSAGYEIDGVLRIGSVPTIRLWRDLEEKQNKITVCSISPQPFSGLSWGGVIHTPNLSQFFNGYSLKKRYSMDNGAEHWLKKDRDYAKQLIELFHAEPHAEPSLFYQLSKRLPLNAHLYLGNSLPIREWDLAAGSENRHVKVTASRGVNGIDGQLSTFLGSAIAGADNWAVLGDLTTLYDLVAPWILPQLKQTLVNLIVVNNKGSQLFARLYPEPEYINPHQLNFRPLAQFWGMKHESWHAIPRDLRTEKSRLIELLPDNTATERFWKKLSAI